MDIDHTAHHDNQSNDNQLYENINNIHLNNESTHQASHNTYDDNLVYEEEEEDSISVMMKDYDKNDFRGKSYNEIFGVNDPYQINFINESTRIKEQKLYESLIQENILLPTNNLLDSNPLDEDAIDYDEKYLSKLRVNNSEAMKLLQKHKSKNLKITKEINN